MYLSHITFLTSNILVLGFPNSRIFGLAPSDGSPYWVPQGITDSNTLREFKFNVLLITNTLPAQLSATLGFTSHTHNVDSLIRIIAVYEAEEGDEEAEGAISVRQKRALKEKKIEFETIVYRRTISPLSLVNAGIIAESNGFDMDLPRRHDVKHEAPRRFVDEISIAAGVPFGRQLLHFGSEQQPFPALKLVDTTQRTHYIPAAKLLTVDHDNGANKSLVVFHVGEAVGNLKWFGGGEWRKMMDGIDDCLNCVGMLGPVEGWNERAEEVLGGFEERIGGSYGVYRKLLQQKLDSDRRRTKAEGRVSTSEITKQSEIDGQKQLLKERADDLSKDFEVMETLARARQNEVDELTANQQEDAKARMLLAADIKKLQTENTELKQHNAALEKQIATNRENRNVYREEIMKLLGRIDADDQEERSRNGGGGEDVVSVGENIVG
ncbi:hypothetical protein HDV00_007276 [Rhizophlyctis rosea]|nr:hypothetical protein HDV00_007276 [Rhizophlyctis rosea]